MTNRLRELQESYERMRRNNAIAALKIEYDRIKALMSRTDYDDVYGDLRKDHEAMLVDIKSRIKYLEDVQAKSI